MSITRTASTPAWNKFVTFIGGLLNKTSDADLDKVHEALTKIGGDGTDTGIDAIKMAEATGDDELKGALKEVSPEMSDKIAKVAIAKIRAYTPPAAVPQTEASKESTAAPANTVAGSVFLPPPLLRKSLLTNLEKAAILTVSPEDVIAGVQVMLASRHGLFDLAPRVKEMVLQRAINRNEQAPAFYHKVDRLLNRRAVGEILKAMDVPGDHVNKKVKTDFISKVENVLVQGLRDFHGKLVATYDSYVTTNNNPMAMQQMLMGFIQMSQGQPGLLTQQSKFDTRAVRAALTTLIDVISRTFSPLGVPACRALLAEAEEIHEFLGNHELWTALGTDKRDEVLTILGVGITDEEASEEAALSQYILGAMKIRTLSTGSNQEVALIVELIQLGNTLPLLTTGSGVNRPAANTGRRNDSYDRSERNNAHKG